MAPIDARIPLGFDTSSIYNPVKAQADQLALQNSRDQLQKNQFEQSMQPFKRQEAQDAQQINALKVARAKTDQALQMLSAAQNPSQWGSVRQSILQSGLAKPEEVPEMYDPRWVHSARMAHMDLKDQLDNKFRNAQLELQREDLAERRLDRKEDRELKRVYYEILNRNANTKAGLMVDPETGEIIPNPNATNKKIIPDSGKKRLLENLQSFKQADRALALLEGKNIGTALGDEAATGWKGMLPEGILQRTDPKGVDTRAAIADIGSLIIHDRSGAAVTASEYPRLKPFIPRETDDAETAKKKLRKFIDTYREILEDTAGFYEELGYKVPTLNMDQRSGDDFNASFPEKKGASSDIKPGSTVKWGDL